MDSFQETQTPDDLEQKLQIAVGCHQQGKLAEAEQLYQEILETDPNHFDALHLLGAAAYQTRRYERAAALIARAIGVNATLAEAHSNLGNALKALNRLDEAIDSYDKAIDLRPNFAEALYNLGTVQQELGQYIEAISNYDRAIALRPNYAEAHANRGAALRGIGHFHEALASLDAAIGLRPGDAVAYNNRGVTLQELGRFEDALASYEKAIALWPDYAEAYSNRGNALKELKRFADAVASYEHAIALKPNYAAAYCNCGVALQELKRRDEAFASYEEAISLRPDYAEAYNNRGTLLQELRRYEEALSDYDRALSIKPHDALIFANKGGVLNKLKRHKDAAEAYERVLVFDPQYPFAKGLLLRQKLLCCDWSGVQDLEEEIECDISAGKPSGEPFGWLGSWRSQESLQRCAELFARDKFPEGPAVSFDGRSAHEKIRIGYLAGEFRDHATSHLLVGVIEQHNKHQFETYIFDNGWDDHSETRKRINEAADAIFNIRDLEDDEAAALIQQREIDILVNLRGYSGEQRTGVFARRSAPVQVNFLGFPGTLGATYMDYIIADETVIPEAMKQYFTEKVVYLPYCYQANDNRRKIADVYLSRAAAGLPEDGFVFCSFNNSYKINPPVFDIWMRLLKKIEGSVLWLLEARAATDNLKKEARLRGVDDRRLVFAPRLPLPEHLARHRLADLFLDTLPYNAHTTASDALWAGLPVLTQIGATFAGRVAASLLRAIELPELVTESPEAYEVLALELATDSQKLALVKHKLAARRLTAPLFHTELFTKHIETAYGAMYQRYHSRLAPDHIAVAP